MLVILISLTLPRQGLQGEVHRALIILTFLHCIRMPELPMNGNAAFWFEAARWIALTKS
jgi:hypothetical protein